MKVGQFKGQKVQDVKKLVQTLMVEKVRTKVKLAIQNPHLFIILITFLIKLFFRVFNRKWSGYC